MRPILRPLTLFCCCLMALTGCDPAEFDADPDVRREARGARTCVSAVRNETGDASAMLNQTLPIVEANQFIVDVPATQARWLCRTDDAGTAEQLYKMGQG